VFDQRQTPWRPFSQTSTQGRHPQLKGLADHVGLAQFSFGRRGGKIMGESRRTRHGNGAKAFHREIITESVDIANGRLCVNVISALRLFLLRFPVAFGGGSATIRPHE
jgi:hypothetical protein